MTGTTKSTVIVIIMFLMSAVQVHAETGPNLGEKDITATSRAGNYYLSQAATQGGDKQITLYDNRGNVCWTKGRVMDRVLKDNVSWFFGHVSDRGISVCYYQKKSDPAQPAGLEFFDKNGKSLNYHPFPYTNHEWHTFSEDGSLFRCSFAKISTQLSPVIVLCNHRGTMIWQKRVKRSWDGEKYAREITSYSLSPDGRHIVLSASALNDKKNSGRFSGVTLLNIRGD
ncbi:hypothetical protein ACFL27_26055 [candidate division CSSED10-310 bacterium]|uniref:WD40 repeat domain-containing protein n=1 Tax=candidate division CSSED10-310 bacterium TaxID=2855610 RepID=A0ABV6Z5E1_UNCC1